MRITNPILLATSRVLLGVVVILTLPVTLAIGFLWFVGALVTNGLPEIPPRATLPPPWRIPTPPPPPPPKRCGSPGLMAQAGVSPTGTEYREYNPVAPPKKRA